MILDEEGLPLVKWCNCLILGNQATGGSDRLLRGDWRVDSLHLYGCSEARDSRSEIRLALFLSPYLPSSTLSLDEQSHENRGTTKTISGFFQRQTMIPARLFP